MESISGKILYFYEIHRWSSIIYLKKQFLKNVKIIVAKEGALELKFLKGKNPELYR